MIQLMSATIYHLLLESPDLKLLLEKAQERLKAEAQKRQEFYEWLTPEVKAEFINGEIIMHSPAKNRHLWIGENLFSLLKAWVDKHQLGEVHFEKALVALTRNDYEPDICFWSLEKSQAIEPETMRHPAPDLVVEILSPSTEHRDRGVKFVDYAAHGVGEYWMIDPAQQIVETYLLDRDFDAYKSVGKLGLSDQLSSQVVNGFEIPVKTIFDKEVYLETLKGLI